MHETGPVDPPADADDSFAAVTFDDADDTSELSIPLVVRDLQQADLELLDWAGGSAHQQALTRALERAWRGEVEVLVIELPTGMLVAQGAVDLEREPGRGWIWMLATHPAWRGLGVGSQLVHALEQRVVDRGLSEAALAVELDNPRAAQLYRRLGYRSVEPCLDSWPTDSGATYVAACEVMTRSLG